MIKALIQTLSSIGFIGTGEEIADILWLASHFDKMESDEFEMIQNRPTVKKVPLKFESREEKLNSSQYNIPRKKLKQSSKPVRAELHPAEQKETIISDKNDIAFQTPGAPALSNKLSISRALRPLMRKVPSRVYQVLDEEETVRQSAETDNWLPKMRPESSRWLDIILVVEESMSTIVWEKTIMEFKALLERIGAFRNIQCYGICTEKKQIKLHMGIGHKAIKNITRNPKELIDTLKQRIILVVSDCSSKAWHDGRIAKMMSCWSNNAMCSIVQLLPYWSWDHTGLNRAEFVYLRATQAGTVNDSLKVEISYKSDKIVKKGFSVPIITLETASIHSWAKSLAGLGGICLPGVIFQLPTSDICLDQNLEEDELPKKSLSLEGKMKRFQANASPLAQQLACYLAGVPLTLPIMRLVQKVMLPKSEQIHLAEIFLSGLLKRNSNDLSIPSEKAKYDFTTGVREYLISMTLLSETVDVITKVTKKLGCFIDKQTGKTIDFKAILVNPSLVDRVSINEDSKTFASVAMDVLRRLGGHYTELSNQINSQIFGIYDFSEENRKINLNQRRHGYLNTLLKGWGTPKDRMTVGNRLSRMGDSRFDPANYYLPADKNMGFVTVPAGKFLMGSDEKNDSEAFKDEIPQRGVDLSDYQIARYPVTVVQYKFYAKETKLNLSANWKNFNTIDNHPVGYVSWNDAVQYCKWLTKEMVKNEINCLITLPNEAQWEKAARGPNGQIYSWGNNRIDPSKANYFDTDIYTTSPVGCFPDGASIYGTMDMIGNVWEWCNNWHDRNSYFDNQSVDYSTKESETSRVLRGGSWGNFAKFCRAANRLIDSQNSKDNYIGFRLLFSPKNGRQKK